MKETSDKPHLYGAPFGIEIVNHTDLHAFPRPEAVPHHDDTAGFGDPLRCDSLHGCRCQIFLAATREGEDDRRLSFVSKGERERGRKEGSLFNSATRNLAAEVREICPLRIIRQRIKGVICRRRKGMKVKIKWKCTWLHIFGNVLPSKDRRPL